MELKEKKCSKCGESKSLPEFNNCKTETDGKDKQCKACRAIIQKRYRRNNRSKLTKKNKEWMDRNPEKMKEYQRNYRNRNPEKMKDIWKRYWDNNPEKKKEINRNHKKRVVEKISDSYISSIIGIPVSELRQLPPELIELKRNIIKLKRAKNERINRQSK